MENLKIGDIITNRREEQELEVVYVSKNKEKVSTESKTGYLSSTDIDFLLEEGYTKKEKPWEPMDGKTFWFISESGNVLNLEWKDSDMNQRRASFLGVFPDEASALARRDEIKKLLGKK